MRTIKILGAGISGLTAAINLAKEGYDVEVYEQNKDVGLRFQGDLQGLENWSGRKNVLQTLENIGININFDCDPISNFKLSNGSKKWEMRTTKPAFYLIKRGTHRNCLDYKLKQQALDLGIKIYFSQTINKNKADIIATGPKHDEIGVIAKGIKFETDCENLVVGLLNNKFAKKGYSYLLISKGYGTIGTCLFDNFNSLNTYYKNTQNIFSELYEFNIKNPIKFGGVGTFSLAQRYIEDKSLVTGEAAGLQDLLWGFGMRYAFVSGYLAARCIIEDKNYQEEINKKFRNKLKASVVNRYLWEKYGSRNYDKIINLVYTRKDILQTLNSFSNFNLLQRMIYPFALKYCKKKYKNLKF